MMIKGIKMFSQILEFLNDCKRGDAFFTLRERKALHQSQAAALLRRQEEKETDKTKQAQIEQTYKKH